jgi:hypothetical protein
MLDILLDVLRGATLIVCHPTPLLRVVLGYACAGMANQRSVRAKRCKRGIRRAFSTIVKLHPQRPFPRRQYFNGVLQEKINKGTRDAIAFDEIACTITFISKLAEDPKPIEALGPVRWKIKNRRRVELPLSVHSFQLTNRDAQQSVFTPIFTLEHEPSFSRSD